MHTAEKDRLALTTCLGFGVGTIGVSILLNGVTVYFPAFMSTVLGQDVKTAGLLLMISKIYDGISDVIIGKLSDATRSKWGRRRPYLLAGAFVSALSFLMIFAPPEMNSDMLTWYMLAALIIYSTGYSLFNVPYMAMPSEMTESKFERSRLLSFRTVFVSIGQLTAMGGTAALIDAGGGNAKGYQIMALVLALVIFTAMLLSFLGTSKAKTLEPSKKENAKFDSSVKSILANKPYCWLIGAKVFQFLAFSSFATTSLLFLLNVLKLGYTEKLYLAIAQNIVTALSMPLWLALEKRIGKRDAYLVGLALMALGSLSWLSADESISLFGLLARGILAGVGAGGMILLSISMLSDALAHDRDLTGSKREGLLSSIVAVVEKTTFAFGVALVGWYLSYSNYIPTTDGKIIDQPESAIAAFYFCYAILPVALFAGNALCAWQYTLGGRYQKQEDQLEQDVLIQSKDSGAQKI
jgi:GPH family glycoside/pentoside/hexuronide:cation symporter